jgi:hypothetical protein
MHSTLGSYARRPGGRNPPVNRLVRGFVALLAVCDSFWAAAVSGAAVAANPRRQATARRQGARAHSYASRGAATVQWAGRSGHTMAIRGPHGGASAPGGLGSTRRARRKIARFLAQGAPPRDWWLNRFLDANRKNRSKNGQNRQRNA